LALSGPARELWGRLAVWLHATFGVLMVAAAAFSAQSWESHVPFDATEDVLHSVAATAMGFAFAFGVVAVAWRSWRDTGRLRWRDAAAVAASAVFPLAVVGFDRYAGLLQRLIFLVAYLWYALEALRLLHLAVELDHRACAAGAAPGGPPEKGRGSRSRLPSAVRMRHDRNIDDRPDADHRCRAHAAVAGGPARRWYLCRGGGPDHGCRRPRRR
jgi:hypothetical protein